MRKEARIRRKFAETESINQSPNMEKKDLFSDLPSEMKIEILSRLPIRSTVDCRLVNKSWLSLINSPEFVKSYKPAPCLTVFEGRSSKLYKVYEVEDEVNYSNNSYKKALIFTIPNPAPIHSCINGLLFLFDPSNWPRDLVICNPVTRECIELPVPRVCDMEPRYQWDSYGFGVSKISGQYKIVRLYDKLMDGGLQSEVEVYTLGTGLWRSVAPSSCSIVFHFDSLGGEFMNGSFHWLAYSEGCPWISCFDLESELFTTLSPPPNLDDKTSAKKFRSLSAFRDTLYLCDCNPNGHEIVIWLMKEYGDEKSWTKQYVLPQREDLSSMYGSLCVIKVLKDGDLLLKNTGTPNVFCYSNQSKAIQENYLMETEDFDRTSAVCLTPSFLQLKTFFPMENVCSF